MDTDATLDFGFGQANIWSEKAFLYLAACIIEQVIYLKVNLVQYVQFCPSTRKPKGQSQFIAQDPQTVTNNRHGLSLAQTITF